MRGKKHMSGAIVPLLRSVDTNYRVQTRELSRYSVVSDGNSELRDSLSRIRYYRMRPEEKTNVTRHHPAHHSHLATGRRASDLAVQWRVGLLPVRRTRPCLGDCAHSSSPWEDLTKRRRACKDDR